MQPKLKINNLTNLQDARYSAAVGFDYVSFSLERGSLKKLAPNLIWNIVNWLEGPEVILELNTQSLEELEHVDKTFNYRYITLPMEEWSDLIFQTTPKIILRANSQLLAEDISTMCKEAAESGFELKIELLLNSLEELTNYKDVLEFIFVSFKDFSFTKRLIEESKHIPYGISFGEEVEIEGLIEYEEIDDFIEKFGERFENEVI